MTEAKQRKAAKEFVARWKDRGSEKADSQPFWISLLRDVLGVEHPEDTIQFESSVMMDHMSYIDGFIPETHVLIEQKSMDRDLDAPIPQSNGVSLTPLQQAKQYSMNLPYDDHPRWIVTCNFQQFRIYDMNQPNGQPEVLMLKDLPDEAHRLQFLVSRKNVHVRREIEMSIEAGRVVAKIHEALREQYNDPNSPESQHSLNVLCVRLVFCLYAESAGVFGDHGMFEDYLLSHRDNARQALMNLFKVLDQKEEDRDPYLAKDDPLLAAFPYADGGLFEQEVEIPHITPEIVDLILQKGSDRFKWRDISPTILGTVFEDTLSEEERRAGGMHYTSLENIHKVIDPLFLDDLRKELEKATGLANRKKRKEALEAFRDRLASLKFLDPACGSGHFLTETFLSLRRLENEAVRVLANDRQKLNGEQRLKDYDALVWEDFDTIKVSISQFHGIELNDFACSVAQTALWIAESQMKSETAQIVGWRVDQLPLSTAAHIVENNALKIDWNDVLSASTCGYIMGNPPYSAYTVRDASMSADLRHVYSDSLGRPIQITGMGKIDYVAGWLRKAAFYMKGTDMRAALVMTSSITKGEQVEPVWRPVIEDTGLDIDFAWRSFEWDSEARGSAHVSVVVVGFHTGKATSPRIYSDAGFVEVDHISPYLRAQPTVFIHSRKSPLSPMAPVMMKGSQASDGGGLFLTEEAYRDLVAKRPGAERFLRQVHNGDSFLGGGTKYCIWVGQEDAMELEEYPELARMGKKVRDYRLGRSKEETVRAAETPYTFAEIRQPESGTYLLVPHTSTQNRRYVPMGFMPADVVATNAVEIIPGATLYEFGVIQSNVFMAWMREVGGRRREDYRLTTLIVYNNFPWPDPTPKQKERIEQTAQAVLDAREQHSDKTLRQMYSETAMPPALRKAHQDNDRAVMAAYGFKRNGHLLTEQQTVVELLHMYQKLADERGG